MKTIGQKDEAIWQLRKKGSRLYGTEENHQTLDKFIDLLSKRINE